MDNITRTFIESFLDGGEGIPIEVNGKVANVEKTEAGKAIYHYIRTHYLPMKERLEAKNLTDAQKTHLNDLREVLVQSIYILIELTRKYLSA